jgi:hypothetical protein
MDSCEAGEWYMQSNCRNGYLFTVEFQSEIR